MRSARMESDFERIAPYPGATWWCLEPVLEDFAVREKEAVERMFVAVMWRVWDERFREVDLRPFLGGYTDFRG